MHHLKLKQRLMACILMGVICAGLLLGCTKPSSSGMTPLTVSILKVGKADAIVLKSNEAVLVIDTGEEDDGEELVDFLNKQGVSKVNALIITHFDKDHVGGADTLIEEMEVDQVYVPNYEGIHTEYVDFMYAMAEKGIEPAALSESIQFDLGDAQVLVEPPLSYEPIPGEMENDNNFSLITTVTHGKNRLLFMGDAEKQRIRQWLESTPVVDCDFLKVPHHGIYNTALEDLFERVSPKYAVICSSQKNPAEAKTLELLKKYGADVFQTKDGNVTLISDGNKLELHQKLRG